MEATSTSRASVTVYQSTWHLIPDNCSFFQDACENLKSCKMYKIGSFCGK